MQGYDTLVGAWNETARDWASVPWQSESRSVYGKVKHILNREKVQYTRVVACDPSTGAIQQMGTAFQCSLPKVLYGNNVQQLPLEDVPAALDALHMLLLQDFPDCPHPSVATPRRIDATDNRQLGSEERVRAALAACAAYRLGRKIPYIGDSASVNWPQNSSGHRSKVYSKLKQICQKEEDPKVLAAAEGVLRVESGVSGLKGLRSDYAKALGLASYSGDLTVGTALGCPGLAQAILGPLNAIVAGVVESEVMTLKIAEFTQAWIDAGFSPVKAYSAIGYAAAVKESGWDNLMLTRQGIHKLKREFKLVGVDPLELEMGALMVRLTKPYEASQFSQRRLAKKQAQEDAVADPALVLEPAANK